MSPVHEWRSRDRELPASDHDLTRLAAPSCQRAFEGSSLRIAAAIGCWWLSYEKRRSRLYLWCARDRWRVEGGPCPPEVVLVLPFDRALLWVIICFFGAIDARGETF